MSHEKEFFSLREVALRLRLHPNTVRDFVKDGRIEVVEIGGRKKVWFKTVEWIMENGV